MKELPLDFTEFYNEFGTTKNRTEKPLNEVFPDPDMYYDRVRDLRKMFESIIFDNSPIYKSGAHLSTKNEMIDWCTQRLEDEHVSQFRLMLMNKMYIDYQEFI